MISLVFSFFSDYLIEVMGALLTLALFFRYFAYRASKSDSVYFNSFSRELKLHIDKEREDSEETHIENIELYLNDTMGKISKRLPQRSLRFGGKSEDKQAEDDGKRVISLREYVSGKQGLMASIHSESGVFVNKTPPNFTELTRRVMNQDSNWTKLFNTIPIEGVTRMIDILPGLFIVLGVFGTFIGISMALPEIAKIDFNDLEASGVILNNFVLSVTYAMKTSIAGIFFSLILTVLNTLFPIRDMRHKIFKAVENSLQTFWYHIHREERAERQLAHIFPKMLETLQNINKALEDQKKAG
jgi:hypothetical protein